MKLYNGDCLEIMPTLPAASVDFILCDLPYGTTCNNWDSIIPMDALWNEYLRIIKDNGAIVLFAQQPFTSKLVMSQLKLFRYEWIWEKTMATGFMNANKMPMKAHENILVFYKHLPKYNPQKTDGKMVKRTAGRETMSTCYGGIRTISAYASDKRHPRTVLKFDNAQFEGGKGFDQKTLHPTRKPVKLCEYFVKTYTDAGDLVLDNCMGSGTTGVACVNTGRDFIGIELDESYFDVAKTRIEAGKYDADAGDFDDSDFGQLTLPL